MADRSNVLAIIEPTDVSNRKMPIVNERTRWNFVYSVELVLSSIPLVVNVMCFCFFYKNEKSVRGLYNVDIVSPLGFRSSEAGLPCQSLCDHNGH